MMLQPTQELERPANPARFTLGRDGHDVAGHAEVLRFADGDFVL